MRALLTSWNGMKKRGQKKRGKKMHKTGAAPELIPPERAALDLTDGPAGS